MGSAFSPSDQEPLPRSLVVTSVSATNLPARSKLRALSPAVLSIMNVMLSAFEVFTSVFVPRQ